MALIPLDFENSVLGQKKAAGCSDTPIWKVELVGAQT
jgi:hypothetical protein